MNEPYLLEHDGEQQSRQAGTPHLRDYIRVVAKRKTLVLIVLIISFSIAVLNTYSKTPYYTASSHVLIERNISPGSLDAGIYAYYDPDFMATQIELIRSSNVALNVVQQLELDTKYRHYFLGNGKKVDIPSNEKETHNGEQVKTDAEIIAGIIRDGLSVEPKGNTKTVYISYRHPSPDIAKLVVDSIVQAYIDETLEIKLATSNYSQQWMTTKAEEERLKLAASEKKLHQYVKENDLVTVDDNLKSVYPEKLAELSSQLTKVQAELKDYETLYELRQQSAKDYVKIEALKVFSNNEKLQQLRQKIFLVEQKRQELSKKYGPKHPKIINVNSEYKLLINEKNAEINRIVDATHHSHELTKAKEENLRQLIAKTKEDMLSINERFMQFSILKREVDMHKALYDSLTSSIKKTTITEQTQDVKIWVLKEANLPTSPSSPKKKRDMGMGLLLGLLGGIGLAFFIDYLDNTIKNGKGIEERFGLTVLGAVEEIRGKSEKIETHLQENPLSPLAESYRLIRSGLLLSSPDHPPRSILITSMAPKEGKTSTTSNLAKILAQGDNKVLIIDCDMRRPRMHSLFGIPNSHGLSSHLSGSSEEKLVKVLQDEAVSLIPSGPVPPNPAELLHSKKMKSLVDEMVGQYDFVLLDSPPIQSVTDSLTLSTLVDGTLLVARSGKTTFDVMESGLKKLNDVRAHILGVVLNGLKKTKSDSGYYGYYDYYSKDKKKV